MNKIPAILVIMDKDQLQKTFALMNWSVVDIKIIVMESADRGVISIGNLKIPLCSFQSFDELLNDLPDKNQFLWLLVPPTKDGRPAWDMAKLIMKQGVSREKIIYYEFPISGTWIANLRYAEKHPIDYFATGISYVTTGFDCGCIEGARGINLSDHRQDLLQSYLTAKYVFEHAPTPHSE